MMTLKILWMNWKCIKHPLAGGAEVYTHEVAKRLARMGHEIILITSRPKNLPSQEIIDGYKVIRQGGKYTVYLMAKRVYRQIKSNGWIPDVIIDEVNTIPFLTPLYAKEPIVILIHQLCKECWKYAFHPFFEKPGWFLEKFLHKIYIKASYKGSVKAIITVSGSTKSDLISIGYPKNKIHIVYNGLNQNLYKNHTRSMGTKEKEPLVIYMGRITPYKRIEDLIMAWKIVEQRVPEANLIIAGRADPKYLKKLISIKLS